MEVTAFSYQQVWTIKREYIMKIIESRFILLNYIVVMNDRDSFFGRNHYFFTSIIHSNQIDFIIKFYIGQASPIYHRKDHQSVHIGCYDDLIIHLVPYHLDELGHDFY